MKKGIFSFVMGASLLMACPFLVHGEGPEEKQGGLLSGTVETLNDTVKNVGGQAGGSVEAIVEETSKSVGKTVKDTVGFTEETVKKVSAPVENKAVTSTLKNTGELVEKAVENTTPVAKTAVKEVTKTTEKTTSEVFDAVDKTVEKLPEVPVVTPVVKEVNKTVQKVTEEVQHTFENTTDLVNETVETVTDTAEKTVEKTTDVVDKAADIPYQEEKVDAAPKPESTKENVQDIPDETPKPVVPPAGSAEEEQPADSEQPVKNEVPVRGEDAVDTKEVMEATPVFIEEKAIEVSEEQPTVTEKNNIKQPAASGRIDIDETTVALSNMTQSPAAENEEEGKEPAASAQMPIFPEKQDGDRTMAIVPAPVNPSTTQASVSFTGHNADLGYGTISPSEMLKVSTEKLWYHKNSYAIIQWIHTPLRKPPETTPFLYVI